MLHTTLLRVFRDTIIACLSLACASPAFADFAKQTVRDSHRLQRCSQTPIRVLGFVNIGAAALYAGDCSQREKPPIQLSIRYARSFSAQELRSASEQLLRRNISAEAYANADTEIARINSWYQDISPGQRYDIHYCEQHGLSLYKDAQLLGKSTAKYPGQSYLNIWLGDKPFSKNMKKALLSK